MFIQKTGLPMVTGISMDDTNISNHISNPNHNDYLKVTISIQEAVKARSLRGVIPRKTSPVVTRSFFRTKKPVEVESHYLDAFNDVQWPDMWYFVSKIFKIKILKILSTPFRGCYTCPYLKNKMCFKNMSLILDFYDLSKTCNYLK